MKRTALRRKTPLRASSVSAWRTKSRRASTIPPAVRAEVVARSGGRCEARVAPDCTGRGEHMHHRLRRSQGGKHAAAVLVHLCRPCHDYTHANPAESYVNGLLIRGVR